jgi:hypothetical protein
MIYLAMWIVSFCIVVYAAALVVGLFLSFIGWLSDSL